MRLFVYFPFTRSFDLSLNLFGTLAVYSGGDIGTGTAVEDTEQAEDRPGSYAPDPLLLALTVTTSLAWDPESHQLFVVEGRYLPNSSCIRNPV